MAFCGGLAVRVNFVGFPKRQFRFCFGSILYLSEQEVMHVTLFFPFSCLAVGIDSHYGSLLSAHP